jgi:hypothetical protein
VENGIKKMIDPLLVISAGIFLVVAGCLISYTNIVDILLIYRTPRRAIHDLPQAGFVEFAGKVVKDQITSPISETPCAFWQVEVKERRTSFKGGLFWESIYLNSSQESFEIRDKTGNIKISPLCSEIILENRLEDTSGAFNEKLQTMLIKTRTSLGFNKPFKVYERLIKADDQIYVLAEIPATDKGKPIERILPAIISDRNERELLNTFYWRVAKKLGMTLFTGGIIITAILFSGLVKN